MGRVPPFIVKRQIAASGNSAEVLEMALSQRLGVAASRV
jgi:hypothetical protein